MQNVKEQLKDDWLTTATWRRNSRVNHRNQFVIQLIHVTVWKPCSTRSNFIAHLQASNNIGNNKYIIVATIHIIFIIYLDIRT